MDETIEVVPSDDNGNVPAEAPSEPTVEPAAPAEAATETTEPVVPEVTLYDLPDGRKVDGETLAKEWKENFLPDYTRKSQELAGLKTKTPPETITTNDPTRPYTDPEWQPKSYAEIIQIAKDEVKNELKSEEQAKEDAYKAIETSVATQLEGIKAKDKTLNEDTLFLHATKFGFTDLNLAYNNMSEMNRIAKTVQKNTADNIAKRVDPVSTTPGNSGGAKLNPDDYPSAREYLRALKSAV